jgi:hypothetical protein
VAVTYNTTIDQGATWYINFIYKQPAVLTNVSGNGTTVTYTCDNAFVAGQTVSIDGVIPNVYNLQNKTIATRNSTSFTVTNGATGTYISGGIATVPMNLSSYTAKLQVRSLPSDPDAVLTLTTENGGITITALTGFVAVTASATQTGAIDEGTYVYDIELVNGSIVTRLAQGQVVVSPEVTR